MNLDAESSSPESAPPLEGMAQARIEVLAGPEELAQRVSEQIGAEAKQATEARDRFLIALSGGSTPRRSYELLAENASLDWSRFQLFVGDERAVPLNDPRSNYRMVRESLVSRKEELVGHLHHLSTESADLETVARGYQSTLEDYLGPEGIFDLVLLGVRPNGALAGLLPGKQDSFSEDRWVVSQPAQEDQPGRVSLSLRSIQRARRVFVIAAGASKAEVVARILDPQSELSYPAQALREIASKTVWFLDRDSASLLET